MGILTLDEMRTEVGSAIGNREGILDSRIDTWLNMAYFDVASGIEFEELSEELSLPTVSAQYEYTGPVAPMVILLARDDDNENLLTKVTLSEFYRLDRTDTGNLTQWSQRGTQILYHPTPTGVVATKIYFRATPTKLAADADVTLLAGYVDVAIILLGTHYGLMATGDDQRGITWLNRAMNYLQSRITGIDMSKMVDSVNKTNLEARGGG